MPSRRQHPRHVRRNRHSRRFTALKANLATIDFVAASVDAVSNQLYIPSHGFQTGSGPVQATTTVTLPTGLVALTDYYIIRVDDHRVKLATSAVNAAAGTAVNITAAGSGVHTLTWTSAFTTTHAAETIQITAHGLQTGDGPFQLTNSGGALPAGYSALTDYWVVKVDDDNLKLAASYANAVAASPTIVAISGDGTGTHTMTRTCDTGVVSTVGDEMVFWNHRLMSGDGPFTIAAGTTLPTGLSASPTQYWAVRTSADAIGFATTRALARAGTKVNLTGVGSGTMTLTASVDAVQQWLARGKKLAELKALDA